MSIRSVGVETTSAFESNFIEAELAISMSEDFPALIWCNGSSQVVTERAELEFRVQVAAEFSSENNPAGHIELCVSEVLNANQSSDEKKKDTPPPKPLI